MIETEKSPAASPSQDGAHLLEAMEAAEVWHLPVVEDGRVIGVVSKENLLRLIGRRFARRTSVARPA